MFRKITIPSRILWYSAFLLLGLSIVSIVALYNTISISRVQQETITWYDQNIEQIKLRVAERISELDEEKNNLESELAQLEEERQDLLDDLDDAEDELDEIKDEFRDINRTVQDLVKLSTTDEELLQKYSRVYFLNENYIPSDLSNISSKYVYGDKTLQIHGKVEPFLDELMEDAEDDDLDLQIISAYRSFTYQQQLKANYVTIYGSGANQFSADQGYSEHQLGSTIDFTTTTVGPSLSSFAYTEEYQWLLDNAYKYGFILSYPQNNSYYQYEPWHWRFVGTDLARDLHRKDANFYDWEQRKIDEYLLDIFD